MTNIQEKTEIKSISEANQHAKEYGTTRKEKYLFLSELSRNLKEAIAEDSLTAEFYEDCEKTNEILKKYYSNQYRIDEFNTFKGWKEKGFKVRKGSKGFLFWSKPKVHKVDEEGKSIVQNFSTDNEDEDKEKMYYISYLFSNLQVEKIKIKEVSMVLDLMDKSISYPKALNLVLMTTDIDREYLEAELNHYI